MPPPVITAPGDGSTLTNTLRPQVSYTHPGHSPIKHYIAFFTPAQYGIGGFDPLTSPATHRYQLLLNNFFPSATAMTTNPQTNIPNGGTYRLYVGTGPGALSSPTDGWDFIDITLAVPVPTPTALTPANGGTVGSSRPTMAASVAAMSTVHPQAPPLLRRRFQWASDTGFTTSVKNILDADYQVQRSGNVVYPTATDRMPQGTWYLRARAEDQYGVVSAWTSTNTILVQHIPTTTNRTPSLGQSVGYATSVLVDWVFSDIDTQDFQLEFEPELWKLSDPTGSLIDPGPITGAPGLVSQYLFTGLDVTWKDTELRWHVRVDDQDGVTGPWSVDNVFYLRDLPVVAVTSPTTDEVIDTPSPLFEWDVTLTDGRTPVQFRVVVTDELDDSVVFNSGIITSASDFYQVGPPVLTVGPDYLVTVTVWDNTGLAGVGTQTFTADYEAVPAPDFTLNTDDYVTGGLVIVDWTFATEDGAFVAWRVYRRPTGTVDWTLLAEYGSGTQIHYDYTSPSGVAVEYAVVQVIISFSLQVESAYVPQGIDLTTAYYVLVVPDDTSLNLTLWSVTGDTFADEQEMATINLIGRGRRAEYGTRYGQVGTLSGSFKDVDTQTAREQRVALEALRDSDLEIYLRNPFGDVWKVALMTASMTRIPGVGLHEMASFTIDYVEITA